MIPRVDQPGDPTQLLQSTGTMRSFSNRPTPGVGRRTVAPHGVASAGAEADRRGRRVSTGRDDSPVPPSRAGRGDDRLDRPGASACSFGLQQEGSNLGNANESSAVDEPQTRRGRAYPGDDADQITPHVHHGCSPGGTLRPAGGELEHADGRRGLEDARRDGSRALPPAHGPSGPAGGLGRR